VGVKALMHPVYFPNIVSVKAMLTHGVVWENEDNFQKQTYRNRCYICTDQGKHRLNIPILHVGGKDGRQKYKDVRINNAERWQQTHWRTLQTAYRTSAFFEFYEDDLAPIFEKKFDFLLDLNHACMQFLTDSLQVPLATQKSTVYEKTVDWGKDLRYLAVAKNERSWALKPYTQVFGDRHGFVENVSALDLLFNEGTNAPNYLHNQEITF